MIALIAAVMSACRSEFDLHKEIGKAIKAGENELLIAPGNYVLDKSIFLDGVENFTIKAENSGEVTITSGMKKYLADFTCLDEGKRLYEITLPELKMDPWPDAFRGYAGWPELYVNGMPMQMARYPNHGYLKADSIINPGSIPKDADSSNIGAKFISKELINAIDPIVIPAKAGTSSDKEKSVPLYLDGYWKYKWYDEIIRVESVNPESGEIIMAAPHRYGLGSPSGGLFYAINRPEFLDREGEYYFNAETGTIRFILPDFGNHEPIISIGYQDFTLFEISNCSNVRVENIIITVHNGLAFNITDSDSVIVHGCRISNLALSAISISGGKNCTVSGTSISKIGGTGISLDGGDKASLTPAHHSVIQCSISDFSKHIKTYNPAVKLAGIGHIVRRNRISRGPHCAIHFAGNDHLIENNFIKNVCLNTSDAGAIYCGRDWTMGGTVIKGNSIQELGQASHHHNWAIYLDDLASGIDVIDNYIVDCPSGILVGGGRYNRILGNKIRNCSKASIMYDARGLGWYQPYINDPDHTLWTRLREVPVDQPPWSERFPWLKEIQDDDPAIPKHVEILNNEIIISATPVIHESVKKYGDVQFK